MTTQVCRSSSTSKVADQLLRLAVLTGLLVASLAAALPALADSSQQLERDSAQYLADFRRLQDEGEQLLRVQRELAADAARLKSELAAQRARQDAWASAIATCNGDRSTRCELLRLDGNELKTQAENMTAAARAYMDREAAYNARAAAHNNGKAEVAARYEQIDQRRRTLAASGGAPKPAAASASGPETKWVKTTCGLHWKKFAAMCCDGGATEQQCLAVYPQGQACMIAPPFPDNIAVAPACS
jgi:hypothetical protein